MLTVFAHVINNVSKNTRCKAHRLKMAKTPPIYGVFERFSGFLARKKAYLSTKLHRVFPIIPGATLHRVFPESAQPGAKN